MSPKSECYSEEQLIACLDGTLPDGQRSAFETHIAGCATCSNLADEIKRYLLRECGSDSDEGEPVGGNAASPFDTDELAETNDYLGKLKGYDIIRVLGRGGYGIVFEALDNALHRNVAIKVLTPELSRQAVARRRFIREARACASINHPNVVTIHGVDDSGDTPFIVMELIPGETLRERLRRQPQLDLLDVLRISSQAAQGLAAAHAQGIIHRDVKPGNIMLLDSLPRVKIADFGLARAATENVELTSHGVAVGTPAYMSPEQVRGEDLDARSDLFALGCVMYAMFSGHSPFHGRTALEIAMRIETHDPPRLAEISKGIPTFLDSIVARLLEKDREKRFQSAAEVADVLSRHLAILNQTPTDKFPVALRMSMLEPAGRAKRSRWPLALSVLTLLAVAAIAGGWFYWRFNEQDAEPRVGVASAASEIGSESPPAVPAGQLKPEVTVAKIGAADFTTIGDALRNVAAGGTVTIQDDAEYAETILLTDAARFAGVRIVSPKHATLRSNAPGPVVTIRSIPRLQWEGLSILAPQMQLGVEINGPCPGLQMTDFEIRRIANPAGVAASVAAFVLRAGAAGTADEPLRIRALRVRDTNVGIVIGNSKAEAVSPKHITIEHCDVQGLSRDSSTLLAMLLNMEDISIHHNTFANGIRGISIVADGRNMPLRCDILHNTWHRLDAWFGWTGSSELPLSMQIHHNLIVDSMQYAPPPSFLAAINSLPPVFTGNTAVVPEGSDDGRFSQLADVATDFPLLSEDSTHPDYLKPDFERLAQFGFLPESAPGRYSVAAEETVAND